MKKTLVLIALATLVASGFTQASATSPSGDAGGGIENADPQARERLDPLSTTMVDETAYHWNMQGFDQEKAVTQGDYQYMLYWDADESLVLARRDLTDNSVETLTFPDKLAVDDEHRNAVVGISADDGRLHLTYDHHNNPINYRVSRANYVTSPPENLSLNDFSERHSILSENEQRATYPRFFNDSQGRLYFFYRHGGSGNGVGILGRYVAEDGSWERVGRLFDRTGVYPPWNDSPTRNAYVSGVFFDDNDRLHISWLYREAGAQTRSNHDVHYAYSDNYGVTWHNNDGAQIADLSVGDGIRVDDPGIVVVEVPSNSGLRGQSGLAIDSGGQPHVLSIQSTVTSPDNINQHYIHHWRDKNGSWHSDYIDDTALPYTDRLRRGDIFLDERDNAHVYLAYGGTLWAARASKASGWTDWDFYSVPTEHRVADFPAADGISFDRSRWDRDGILTLPTEVELGDRQTGFALLDFEVNRIPPTAKPPTAPSLAVTDNGGSEPALRLQWTTIHEADSYNVYRTDTDSGKTTRIAKGVAAGAVNDGYVDADPEPGVNYAYHVKAVNHFGDSTKSNVVNVIIRERDPVPWDDYRVAFTASDVEANTLAPVFRQQDRCHLYAWQLRVSAGALHPVRISNCNQQLITDEPVPLPSSPGPGISTRVAIDLTGSTIATYLDGELLVEVADATYDNGFIGFRTSNSGGPAFVDDVIVHGADGETLFEDDFSSGDNPFVADGNSPCDAEVVDGRLRIPRGNWCRLSPYYTEVS